MNTTDQAARPDENKLFRTVADVAPELWEDVAALPPKQVAAASGASLEPGPIFTITFLGGLYRVDMTGRTIEGPPGHLPPNFQKAMVLLRYLAQAQDFGLSGRMVSARELNGGALFFTGPHALLTEPITRVFGREPEKFLAKAETLGLATVFCGSSYCSQGEVLPNIAVGCVLYPEDDEFPAELTYTFDSYAHFHLALDGIWALINILVAELTA